MNLPLKVAVRVFAEAFLIPLAVIQLWQPDIITATSSVPAASEIISAISFPSFSWSCRRFAAISQILSDDEGSCVGIANEVGTAKIANPFASGDISYVESPYSYNSIADFRDNIRSIRNIWLGSTDKKANDYSFHTFFASVKSEGVNTAVENGYVKAIEAISNMPSAFVKYCSTIWGIAFEDDEDWEVEE